MATLKRGLTGAGEADKPQHLSAIDRQAHCTGRPALTKAPSQPLRNNGRRMTQVLHEPPHVDVKVDCVPGKSSRRGRPVASGNFPSPGSQPRRSGSGAGGRPRRPGPERGAIGEQNLETPGLCLDEQAGSGVRGAPGRPAWPTPTSA